MWETDDCAFITGLSDNILPQKISRRYDIITQRPVVVYSVILMAGWRSHTGEGCTAWPQWQLTIWGVGSGRSLSPVEVHTHGSHKQLKRPGRCHLCGYYRHTHTHTNTQNQICPNITATAVQMIKLIVSHCLMANRWMNMLCFSFQGCCLQYFGGILAVWKTVKDAEWPNQRSVTRFGSQHCMMLFPFLWWLSGYWKYDNHANFTASEMSEANTDFTVGRG